MTLAARKIEPSAPPSSIEILLMPAGCRFHDPLWEKVKAHLMPAIEISRGNIKLKDVMAMQRDGRAQMWIAKTPEDLVSAVLVTERIKFVGGKRAIKTLLCGGKGMLDRAMGPMLETVESFARDLGCQSMIVEGRKGWERALPGYTFSALVLEKEL